MQPEIKTAEMDDLEAMAPMTDAEWFQQLASLSPVEYDRQRDSSAKHLGIRVRTLDSEVSKLRPATSSSEGTILLTDAAPWPEPVSLDELLAAIAQTIRRFVIVSEESITAIALWIVFTYTFDSFSISPNLAILSPEKRCGKSTLLDLMTTLVARALPTSNCTPSTIFRGIEKYRPTLLIDEADSFMTGNEELRGILNSGHRKSMANVLRSTGDDHTPTLFSTWCPKSIAAIGKLSDTLMDRSITISMRRKSPGESVERQRFDRITSELEPIRQKLTRWARDHHMSIALSDPAIPTVLNDRAADNWGPLFSLADAAGGNWPELTRKASVKLSGSSLADDESARTILLADIQAIFKDHGVERLKTDDIVADLVVMEDRPWPEWKKSKPITPRQIANILKPFDIKPKTVRIVAETPRGYDIAWFADAFSRYLPSQSATSATTNKTEDLAESQSATKGFNVADKKDGKSNEINDVADVADRNGEPWRERV
jgi:putative DNA primase/helicase